MPTRFGTRLSRTQYKRLPQIAIQQHGYRALVTPDVASAVGLSLEQEQRIKAILDNRESERAAFVRRLRTGYRLRTNNATTGSCRKRSLVTRSLQMRRLS